MKLFKPRLLWAILSLASHALGLLVTFLLIEQLGAPWGTALCVIFHYVLRGALVLFVMIREIWFIFRKAMDARPLALFLSIFSFVIYCSSFVLDIYFMQF